MSFPLCLICLGLPSGEQGWCSRCFQTQNFVCSPPALCPVLSLRDPLAAGDSSFAQGTHSSLLLLHLLKSLNKVWTRHALLNARILEIQWAWNTSSVVHGKLQVSQQGGDLSHCLNTFLFFLKLSILSIVKSKMSLVKTKSLFLTCLRILFLVGPSCRVYRPLVVTETNKYFHWKCRN